MIKVAMIGAGSVVFSKNLTGDILCYPEFKNATFSYMDIDPERLEVGANLCRKVAKALGANPKIEATLDRREALRGADFVINMVQIGGFDSTLVDFEIPRKYGLNFTIADTTGPGGLFRALRTFPMLTGSAATWMELCPRAVLLNYSNPMSMNMQTIMPHERHPRGRAVPQRAGDVRPAHGVHRRRPERGRLHLRRHQPHGVLPAASKRTASISTRACSKR